jgi:phosphoribosylaminoimidazolecarboxamide formyltransferase / IMP cyclohydrolase
MNKKIQSALISVYYKDGLEPIVKLLSDLDVTIYSTGGTQQFIEKLGIKVVPVENLTGYPSILGGRVKTLHPAVFGAILGRRDNETDVREMKQFKIPEIDLVIVDLYPFEETLQDQQRKVSSEGVDLDEALIIEKIDIGGPSMIRGAAKNFKDVVVVAAKDDYDELIKILYATKGETTIEQRKAFAANAFKVVAEYDIAIYNYFHRGSEWKVLNQGEQHSLRYGENPHQKATFYGDWNKVFNQLHGKEISYNNLVDIDAAIQLINEFPSSTSGAGAIFAIIKHTNVCGIAVRSAMIDAWKSALASDSESAFGGVLICNGEIDKATAETINEIFFEVLIAKSFSDEALLILKTKKNRILLQLNQEQSGDQNDSQLKSVLNGFLMQDTDKGNYNEWKESGGRQTTAAEREDLVFANIVCKHLKSNAIALVRDKQLIGKGCGQTSRIDALRQAIEKARQFNFSLNGAVMASDAFFPFNDCVKMGHEAGVTAFIQPGGSIRDKDSIDYCKENNLAMVMTGMRHFRH